MVDVQVWKVKGFIVVLLLFHLFFYKIRTPRCHIWYGPSICTYYTYIIILCYMHTGLSMFCRIRKKIKITLYYYIRNWQYFTLTKLIFVSIYRLVAIYHTAILHRSAYCIYCIFYTIAVRYQYSTYSRYIDVFII